MRKYFLVTLVIIGLGAGVYVAALNRGAAVSGAKNILCDIRDKSLSQALALLKTRKDNQALLIFEQVLASQPDNLDALWGKAEVFRRSRKYQESEELLARILKNNPAHIPSLVSLSYIRYNADKLSEALKLIKEALRIKCLNKEDHALAYMMLGSINSRRSKEGWLFSKFAYGTHIKGYFLKAKELAPGLPEAHLGLGTFYLLAPAIVGGNLDKALRELQTTVRIAPDFATANARLAQAYNKKGDLEKYNFYLDRARQLDPENEVLKEIKMRP